MTLNFIPLAEVFIPLAEVQTVVLLPLWEKAIKQTMAQIQQSCPSPLVGEGAR